MGSPRVQVVLGGSRLPDGLRGALRTLGATTSFTTLAESLRTGPAWGTDAVVIVPPEDRVAGAAMHNVLARNSHSPFATIVLDRDGEPSIRSDGAPQSDRPEALADQLAALIHMHRAARRSVRADVARTATHRRSTGGLRSPLNLAERAQRELRPRPLPTFDTIEFSAVHRPAERHSGDFYDVRRIDGTHVAIMLADAVGHGLPAALLGLFMRRAMAGTVFNTELPIAQQPDAVLRRLNRELLEAELSECEFIAAVYAVLNVRTRRGLIARAGMPHPILRRADGRAHLVRCDGMLLGVQANVNYSTQSFTLNAGDALLLYTDGVELVTREEWQPAEALAQPGCDERRAAEPVGPVRRAGRGATSLFAVPVAAHEDADDGSAGEPLPADELIRTTSWFARLQTCGTEDALDSLAARHAESLLRGDAVDDLTVLAVRARG